MDFYFIGWIFVFLLLLFVGFLAQKKWVMWFLIASFVAIIANQLAFSFFIQWLLFLGIAGIGVVMQLSMIYMKKR